MTITPASSNLANPSKAADPARQALGQLVNAIQSGDADAAQQAFANVTQNPTGQAAEADPHSPLGQALGRHKLLVV